VVVWVLIVVFYLNLKRRLVDGPEVVRAEGRTGSPNVEMCQIWQGGNVPIWDGARNGIFRGMQLAEYKPCCRGKVVVYLM